MDGLNFKNHKPITAPGWQEAGGVREGELKLAEGWGSQGGVKWS
jgi:hypothetical protein